MIGHRFALLRNRIASAVVMLTGFTNPAQTIRLFLGHKPVGTIFVRTRDKAYDFEVRSAMDVWCLKETLLDDVYQRHGYRILSHWLVIDIGAGFGDFSVLAARAATNGRVYACEPFPDSSRLLDANLRRSGHTNAQMFSVAVTGAPREVVLDFSSSEPLWVEGHTAAAAGIPVESQTLAEIIESEGIERLDLLKLDCEGCEYEVLFDSPSWVIERIDRVVMEYHELESGKKQADLVSFLQRHGFETHASPNPVHPATIGYLWAARPGLDGQTSVR